MDTNLVLIVLKIFVSTNMVARYPGNIQFVPPLTIVSTNYVIGFKQGTNTVELMTITKSQKLPWETDRP